MKRNPRLVAGWLETARKTLRSGMGTDDPARDPALEAQLLVGRVTGKPRAWVLSHPEFALTKPQLAQLEDLLAQLSRGVPLPYLLGQWEFFGLAFYVTPDVLIPRPETELLVERALRWLHLHPSARKVADIGTGSGCIAVSLSKHAPGVDLLAVDISRAALGLARGNAQHHNVAERIHFVQASLLSALAGPVDLICANLPYIPSGTLADLPVAVYEPRLALYGGPDGLSSIRSLLSDVPRVLAAGGAVLLEIQYDQGEAVARLAESSLPSAHVTVLTDLAGLPRLVEIDTSTQREV